MTAVLELSTATLAWCFAALLLGGTVKGTIGIGLPLVSVPLLAMQLPVPTAIAVLGLPVLISNLVQMNVGGGLRPAVARFWPLLAALVCGILIGAHLLAAIDERRLSLFLGCLVIVFALLNLVGGRLTIPLSAERWIGPPLGFAAGVLGGLSSFFGPPVVMYFVALKMPKTSFVSAIALIYFAGTLPLYAAMAWLSLFGLPEVALSALALLPVGVGLWIGQHLRQRLPQDLFSRLVLVLLTVIGATLIWRAL
ncbi:sulfite exporter TauE/SafE family protein [Algihabitans albus]|uniref:sulfite exporter TauE/SafE family protein n=1 Tax=Algihabitans albus TaxID=2164067 RepID=UPI000E5DA449|nr:sulfite exporter TauE/SafE family protein [Algihabitans albus]